MDSKYKCAFLIKALLVGGIVVVLLYYGWSFKGKFYHEDKNITQNAHSFGNSYTKNSLWKKMSRPVGFAVRFNWHRYLCPHFGPRLGNLMFLYSSYYGTAFKYNVTLVLDSRRDPIYIPFTGIPRSRVNKRLACNGSFYSIVQRKPRYFEHFVVPRYGNIRLSGYLQSWKYFSDSFSDLKKQFTWQPHIKRRSRLLITSIVNKTYPCTQRSAITTVGIHARRGDYVKEGRPVADMLYFKKAKEWFLSRFDHVVFIVATTPDTEARQWVEKNIIMNDPRVSFSGHNDAFVDMCILGMLDHIIISTGTFGWWAAFLNQGTVIHYDWIPPNHAKYRKEDYILPYWIGIKPSNNVTFRI